MVAPIREPAVTAFPVFRLAAIGVLALSFALTACGRRGPLDPPPRATAQSAPQQGQQQQQQTSAAENAEDEDGTPVVPRGEKKRFPLDWLLN
jgi:predicted small lipoprotein YifL